MKRSVAEEPGIGAAPERARLDGARVSAAPEPTRLQRRPLMVVIGVALVAAGGVLGLWLWASASTASEVVAVRADLQRGQLISVEALTTVRITLDPQLRTVPGAELETLVGKRAVTDLAAGTLLSPGQVSDQVVPQLGESVVGIPVAPGLMPAEPLLAGDTVRLVHTPGQAGEVTAAPVTVTARVLTVTAGDTHTVVDVVVSSDQAAELAARAATGDLAVVLDSRER